MADPTLLPFSAAALIGTAMASAAALRTWNGWLELKRERLHARSGKAAPLDLVNLRARVRRLESIADGRTL